MPYFLKMTIILACAMALPPVIRWIAVRVERCILHFYPDYCPEVHLLGMPLPIGMKMIISNPRQRWIRRGIAFVFIAAFVAVLYWTGAFD